MIINMTPPKTFNNWLDFERGFWKTAGEGRFPESGRPCVAQRTAGTSPESPMLQSV
jgi:hypothetical protein